MGDYPFYHYQEGNLRIRGMKVSIDKDWSKEMQGLLVFHGERLVFSKGYMVWVDVNYVPVGELIIPGDWISALIELRDKVVSQSRTSRLKTNRDILDRLRNVHG